MRAPTYESQAVALLHRFSQLLPRYVALKIACACALDGVDGKQEFVWQPDHQLSFKETEALVAGDAWLAYPDHKKPFHEVSRRRLCM